MTTNNQYGVHIDPNAVYRAVDLPALLGVHRNTVSKWMNPKTPGVPPLPAWRYSGSEDANVVFVLGQNLIQFFGTSNGPQAPTATEG